MEPAANRNNKFGQEGEQASDWEVVEWVNAEGKLCPEPLLLGRQALARVQCGQIIAVRSTDPHSELDFEVFALRAGHELIDVKQTEGRWVFFLRKSGDANASDSIVAKG